MGALGLAQPLALSTPLSNAQLPFPLFVNGNEISGGTTTDRSGADALTYGLRDQGLAGPQQFRFTVHDHTGSISAWLDKQQPVGWFDSAAGRPLFRGYTKQVKRRPVGPWADLEVTCLDLSESLDTAIPISSWDSGVHARSDQAEVQALLANFLQDGSVYGSGGFIQVLNASMPSSVPHQATTLRNAIDQVMAATGVTGAVAYVDSLGYLHTLATGDVSAPYAISDTPNYTTSVPAVVDDFEDGSTYADALWVNGATAAGSGAVYAWQCGIYTPAPSPLRWAVLDAPESTTAAAAIAAATVEFQRRRLALTVTLVVTGYDGWAKGQLLTITNGPLGWSAKQLIVSSVDMAVIAGTGVRRYTITAGSDPVLFTARLRRLHAQFKHVAAGGRRLRGRIGGA